MNAVPRTTYLLTLVALAGSQPTQSPQEWTGFIQVQVDLGWTQTLDRTQDSTYRLPSGYIHRDWRTTNVNKDQSGDRFFAITVTDGKVTKVDVHKRMNMLGNASWTYELSSLSNSDGPSPQNDYYWWQNVSVESIALSPGDVTATIDLQQSGSYTIKITGHDAIATSYTLMDVTNGYNNAPNAISKLTEKSANWKNSWVMTFTGTTCDALKAQGSWEELYRKVETVDPAFYMWYEGSKTAYPEVVDTLKTPLYVSATARWNFQRKPPANGAFAIVSDITYPQTQTVAIPDAAKLPIRITTCGSTTPIAGVKLKLAADKGQMASADITTDANGSADGILIPPKESGPSHVTIDYELTRPDGTKEPHHERATVDFTKKRTTFPARLMVHAVTRTTDYDMDGAVSAKSEVDTQYAVDQVLELNAEIYTNRMKYPRGLASCNSSMSCPVLSGDNNSAPTGQAPQRTSAIMSTRSLAWERKFDGNSRPVMQLVRKSDGGGPVAINTVTTSVSLIAGSPGMPSRPDTTRGFRPVPLVNPNYYFRLEVKVGSFMPDESPGAPREQSTRYDSDTKKWIREDPPRRGMEVPDVYLLNNLVTSEMSPERDRTVVQPAVSQGAMLAFLRNPDHPPTFSTAGLLYDRTYDGNKKLTREVEERVWVTLQVK